MKKDIMLTIVLVVLLLSFGYYNAERQRIVKSEMILPKAIIPETITSTAPCGNISDTAPREVCYFNLAKSTKNTELCDDLVESTIKINCYVALANLTKNAAPCIKINIDYQRDFCYKEAAISSQNPIICGGILYGALRHQCYKKISIRNLDPFVICPQIQIIENRAECYNEFKIR